jgi:hypothetical protein
MGKFDDSSYMLYPVYIRLFTLGLSNRHCRSKLRYNDRRCLPSKYLIVFPTNDYLFSIKQF